MRFTGAAANSASQLSTIQYRTFVDIGVTSTTLYLVNGNQFLNSSATNNPTVNTYSPVGGFGGIEPLQDQADVRPSTARMWMRAVGSADVFEPLREDMFNRPVVVRHGYLDAATDALVSTPEVIWKGFVNKVDIRFADTEKGNYFEIEAETSLRRKSELINFTKEALQTVMGQSGDTFFDYIFQVPMVKALWGNQPTAFNGVSPGHWGYSRSRPPGGGVPTHGGYRTWTPGG